MQWKWHLLVIFVITLALSFLFSSPFFIKPKFKSFAVIYPANVAPYSSESNTEQILQLLKSEELLYNLVKKFNLYQVYDIDSTEAFHKSNVINKLESNLSIKRTEYESVLIEIYDRNPVTACEMVKELLNQMDMKARQLQREKTAEVLKINYDRMTSQLRQIDSIEKRMQFLRSEYNILDYNIQVKEYSKGYVKNITSGRAGTNNDVTNTLENLKKYGGEFRLLNSYLFSLVNNYNEIKIEYDKSLSDLNKELTYSNIVTKPVPADKKSYPVRWLIVLISVFATTTLSLILFSFISNHKTEKATN